MAIDIRPLSVITADNLAAIGGGYASPAKYAVHKVEDDQLTVITVELVDLETPYVKRWEKSDAEEMARYQDYARQGYSLGAYEGDTLVGFALCEARQWNRTLWIWEFHVAPTHRRRGIGRCLMEAVVRRARQAGFRIIGLETQSANVPAIAFYRAVGFELDAIDLSFYTNTDMVDGEVAFFMKRKLG